MKLRPNVPAPGWRGLVAGATGLLLMTSHTPAHAVVAPVVSAHAGRPDFDARTGFVLPTQAQLASVAALGAKARWNVFGTPASLINQDGFLGSAPGADPATAAREWVRANRGLFRLSDADVTSLELVNAAKMPGSNGRAVLFRQRFGGLLSAQDGMIAVGLVDGQVAYVSSSAVGSQAAPAPALLSPLQAWLSSASSVGRLLSLVDLSSLREENGWTLFSVPGFAQSQRARLVAFPTPTNGVRAAFETLLLDVKGGQAQAYTSFVDARTGEVLFRQNRVLNLAEGTEALPLGTGARWKFFTANPPLDFSATDTRVTACWATGEGCNLTLDNLAARGPWDFDFRTGLPSFTTIGNAAVTAEAWLSPLTPAEQYRPASLTRDYSFPWTNAWFNSRCSPTAFLGLARNDVDAAAANLFAMHNRMHDWSYLLGFTEENYNLQDTNFSRTAPGLYPLGGEFDPELGNVQAGGLTGGAPTYLGRDNANQIALNDGIPGITNMYLWQPIAGAFYPRCVDGDYDMSVIGHEYTHAISNRMVGGPDGNLTGLQAGSMGESWSDLAAVEYLLEYGLVPPGENPFAVGAYVTGHPNRGIRNYPLNDNPLHYGNVGYDLGGAEVHSDGEVWNAVNYDLRQAFIARYDASFPSSNAQLQRDCADGKVPVTQCPGNRRWIQLVFDAFLLMQPEVSMVDARDAYLAADKMRFGGAHQALLWREFARRGLGQHASSVTSEDATPVPSFETPVETDEAAVTFRALAANEGGVPVNAKVYVGQYEARSRAVADTDPSTPLPATARLVPGTYDFVVQADGYGMHRFRRQLGAGQTLDLTASLPTNWASRSKRATALGDGVNLDKLIDDTESTNWARIDGLGMSGSRVTVALGGGARTVRRVHVSAMLRPADANDLGGDTEGQNRFTALRSFQLYACSASVLNLYCGLDSAFTRVYSSPSDAFPGDRPRPAVPDLQLRAFDIPATTATHLQLRVIANQCTGGPAFQGDQDDDPANDSDCSSGSESDDAVRAAELQVFSSSASLNE